MERSNFGFSEGVFGGGLGMMGWNIGGGFGVGRLVVDVRLVENNNSGYNNGSNRDIFVS